MAGDQSQPSPPEMDDGDPSNITSQSDFSWSESGKKSATSHAAAVADDGDSSQSENEGQSPGLMGAKLTAPIQKRRRVTRACDECRRKKIKCDGKQPCTHCTVYSYDCTYDQPSNRRRNPAPQYIEAIENRLHRAEALLKSVMPDVDLSDPNLQVSGANGPHFPQPGYEKNAGSTLPGKGIKVEEHQSDGEKDSMLESMVANTGALDLDDKGHYDFYGHSSGIVFIKRLRQQFGDLMGAPEGHGEFFVQTRNLPSMAGHPAIESPRSIDSPMAASLGDITDLPNKAYAKALCDVALEDALALMRFIHRPTFNNMIDRIFDTPQEQWGNEENRYLPLVYAVMSVGTLFSRDEQSRLQTEGYEHAVEFGIRYFKSARQLMDIMDCRDLPSLQAVMCMIYFLQSSAKLSTCYSYVGVALHSAIRMGLHRSMPGQFNPIENEIRKRIFWQIRKFDIYIAAFLGFPMMLSDDDIDQEQPLPVDDEYITLEGIKPMPESKIPLMAAMNAHTGIVKILQKVNRYIYPLKGTQQGSGTKPNHYSISHARIREIEKDLQDWMEALPQGFRPGGNVSPEFTRIQQLLRIAYAHTQLFLYRPFLHYTSTTEGRNAIDKRSYACAAACVSVSRNAIHIVGEMSKRGLLNGAYWFTMYTAFLSVASLVFFVIENPNTNTSADIIKDATEGKQILAHLSKRSMAADRCARLLDDLFRSFDKIRSLGETPPSKKRAASPNLPQRVLGHQSTPNVHTSNPTRTNSKGRKPQRASTFPDKTVANLKRTSAPFTNGDSSYPASPTSRNIYSPVSDVPGIVTPDSPSNSSAASTTVPYNGGFLNPQQSQQGMNSGFNNLPDLSPLMFPTGDPFAYPNQPMTTLEQSLELKDFNLPQGMFTSSSNQSESSMRTSDVENNNGGNHLGEVQIMGPMPPYMMHGQQSNMGPNIDMMGMGFNNEDMNMGQQGGWTQSPQPGTWNHWIGAQYQG